MRRKRHYTTRCECGEKKTKASLTCPRCLFLDGETPHEFDIIQLLREASDGLSVVSLTHETGRFSSAVYRTLHNLERKGRVTRHQDAEGAGRHGGPPPLLYRLHDRGGVR